MYSAAAAIIGTAPVSTIAAAAEYMFPPSTTRRYLDPEGDRETYIPFADYDVTGRIRTRLDGAFGAVACRKNDKDRRERNQATRRAEPTSSAKPCSRSRVPRASRPSHVWENEVKMRRSLEVVIKVSRGGSHNLVKIANDENMVEDWPHAMKESAPKGGRNKEETGGKVVQHNAGGPGRTKYSNRPESAKNGLSPRCRTLGWNSRPPILSSLIKRTHPVGGDLQIDPRCTGSLVAEYNLVGCIMLGLEHSRHCV